MKIAVIGLYNSAYKPLADIVLPNWRYYCSKHKYDLYVHEGSYGINSKKRVDQFVAATYLARTTSLLRTKASVRSMFDKVALSLLWNWRDRHIKSKKTC